MKPLIIIFASLFSFLGNQLYSQSLEVGTSFSSSNAAFYKNTPGVRIGFSYELKRQFLFTEIYSSIKNNSYSEIEPDLSDGKGYIMYMAKGKFYANSIKLGIAQKLIDTKVFCISAGTYACLNYFYINENRHYFYYENETLGSDNITDLEKRYNNRPGIGGLIDLELKKLISNRISLYSRIGGDIIHFDGRILGNPFAVNKIASLNYTLGIKIKLTNDFACP